MKTNKHFEFTGETIVNRFGTILHQIRATKDTKYAKIGDIGGWIEKEENLHGDAQVYGDANISSNNDHCGFDLFGSANRHTHAYKTADGEIQVTCGCFKGSLEEFHKKVGKTHAGTIYEKQYKMIIELIKLKLAV